ncbi:PfaD family protein [Desulfatibacillum aliphaticivorans]|uniref:PfaD family protein n=1 Tax=Desulfatibacillum aliphaticivorans TaxID=218208 RepID=B8FK82_DESAL|nr:PfaD family polyunsaturated fatty acid/polyketide biosynthesis protein [Desulfatibacillum aliphaticivorans]ACL02757.1 PfaD family protein [Desulfatibacillum aliphaticivorans]
MNQDAVGFSPKGQVFDFGWSVPEDQVVYDEAGVKALLEDLSQNLLVVDNNGRIGLTSAEPIRQPGAGPKVIAMTPALPVQSLGNPEFGKTYGTDYPYYAGAMANGIASVEMVTALGKAGFLGSFGAGGLIPSAVEEAILAIQKNLPNGPYLFNFIHSPHEPAVEQAVAELYIKYGVKAVEAAAFMALTPSIVQYRIAGLNRDAQGNIVIGNRIIAKVSRKEVASRFMEPAPERVLKKLISGGVITEDQADMARQVPMADDITVEADSGGHTDNRALVTILPSILSLRDEIQAKRNYPVAVRVGAGGGMGSPQAVLAAFVMGAEYIVTGSVNQACVESGASDHVKGLLAKADMADTVMAPSADMFELGVKVQVLKRGSLFAVRAAKLHDIYSRCESIESIPPDEREKLENQIFKKNLDEIWADTIDFFSQRDPGLVAKAEADPKKKMALIFRWYLGLSSRWANKGEPGREMDYQIWCGSCIGAFNAWVKGTGMEAPENRQAAHVARHLMNGAAYLHRVDQLKLQGVLISPQLAAYKPD